jgi:hypothetical protein
MEKPRIEVQYKSGCEGPAHDPYGYDEFFAVVDDTDYLLHDGLAQWLKITKGSSCVELTPNNYPESIIDVFEKIVGRTLADIYKEYMDTPVFCKDHPDAETEEKEGYPGESFSCCSVCGRVVDSHFNESAVM